MSFIGGLGIPCSTNVNERVYYESVNAEESHSKKRLLSARQRNEPILVINAEVIGRSNNNST